MRPYKAGRSVRRSLLLLLLPASVALMGLAWFIHGQLLEQMSREFVEGRLEDEVAFLEHQLGQSGQSLEKLDTSDYFEEVFHHAFAIQSADTTIISPGPLDEPLRHLLSLEQTGMVETFHQTEIGGKSRIVAYRKAIDLGGSPATIIVAEDLANLHQTQTALHLWTAAVSLLLVGLLVSAIWAGITLALRPVQQLQWALGELRAGKADRIQVTPPEEFEPLVTQLNQLLDTLDQRLKRSRQALANLSHSVKTPVAAIRQILEDQARPLDPQLRQEMADRLSDLDRQLEAELRRSQLAGPQAGKGSLPVKQARNLLWMLGRLYPDKRFELETDLAESRRWPMEEHDLNEVLGNLLDNAGKWAGSNVELSLKESHDQLVLAVTDDGPGVSPTVLESLGTRGLRLDEQTPGHGLGLAIVTDIVSRYGGSVRFSLAERGGLRARIAVPASPEPL